LYIVSGNVFSSDHDLIGNSSGSSGFSTSTGDVLNPSSVGLGGLTANGGPTQTIALLTGSAAIDKGDSNAAPAATDQRGYARIVGSAVDIGDYESGATIATTDLSVSGNAPSLATAGGQISYTLNVTNNSSSAQSNITLADVLPTNTTLVSWTAPSGWSKSAPAAGSSGTISAWISSLAANTSAMLTLVVQVNSNTAPGVVISDTASVGPTTGDTNLSNNSVNFQTRIQAVPKVSVTDAGGTYNGSQFPATATVAGVNGIPGSSLEGVGLTLDYIKLNSDGTTTDLGSSAPYLPGSYSVTASFAGSTDYAAASNTTSFTIQLPTPTITPFLTSASTGLAIGVPGQPLTDTFAINDTAPGITFSINYGDGTNSVTTAAGAATIELDHIYTVTGSFTLTVTATDKNGVSSQQATLPITITTVAMEKGPSGGTALAVGGNAVGGDSITLAATNTTGKLLDVQINKTDYGTFQPTGRLFVYGQGGHDKIMLKPYVVGNSPLCAPCFSLPCLDIYGYYR
jgi:uncharacterized repeat protein (TIGR01451 family)